MAAHVSSPNPKADIVAVMTSASGLPGQGQKASISGISRSFGFCFWSCLVFNPYYQESVVFALPLLGKLLGKKSSSSEVGNGRWMLR